jgi:hypothetical protein
MSPQARKRIAEPQRKRWAEWRAEHAGTEGKEGSKSRSRQGRLTEEEVRRSCTPIQYQPEVALMDTFFVGRTGFSICPSRPLRNTVPP